MLLARGGRSGKAHSGVTREAQTVVTARLVCSPVDCLPPAVGHVQERMTAISDSAPLGRVIVGELDYSAGHDESGWVTCFVPLV